MEHTIEHKANYSTISVGSLQFIVQLTIIDKEYLMWTLLIFFLILVKVFLKGNNKYLNYKLIISIFNR